MKRDKRVILIVFMFILIKTLGMFIIKEFFGVNHDSPHVSYFSIYMESVIFLITIVIYWKRYRGNEIKKNGWREIVIYLPYILISLALLIIVLRLGENRSKLNIMLLVQVIITSLLIGVSEELIFRVILYRTFREKWNIKKTIFVNALLFSMVGFTNIFAGISIGRFLMSVFGYFLLGAALFILADNLNNIYALILCRWIWIISFMLGSIFRVQVDGMILICAIFITVYAVAYVGVSDKVNA